MCVYGHVCACVCEHVYRSHADSVRREAKEVLKGWLRDSAITNSSPVAGSYVYHIVRGLLVVCVFVW